MMKPSHVPATYALTGGLVFDGEKFLPGTVVVVHRDRIQALTSEQLLDASIQRIDVEGSIIAPGFIDLQLNGCGGALLNDAISPETLRTMHQTNLRSGCTSFLPTLITTTEQDMRTTMQMVEKFRETEGGASIIGLHLEGPYISKERKGIHNEAEIKSLSSEMRDTIIGYAQRMPLMLTLAPECVDENDIRTLSQAGVVVSLGHSNATYEEAKSAVKAGARAVTHLFNAMSPWQGRAPGMVGAILDSPDLLCGLIVDGHHVHYASLSLAQKMKPGKCFLVTDATTPVGTAMTEFPFGGQTVYVRDGMCVNADGTLGGSVLTMIEAVANGVGKVGWSLVETLRMASTYPAHLMGQGSSLGKIVPSYFANMAIFSSNAFEMVATVDRGMLHIWKTD